MSIAQSLSMDEIKATARELARILVKTNTPETLRPVAAYGFFVASRTQPPKGLYVEFLRVFTHLIKPGYSDFMARTNGDPALVEILEDECASRVYDLLADKVELS